MADSIVFGGKFVNLKRYPVSGATTLTRNPISDLAISKYSFHKLRFLSNNTTSSSLTYNYCDTKTKRDSIVVSLINGHDSKKSHDEDASESRSRKIIDANPLERLFAQTHSTLFFSASERKTSRLPSDLSLDVSMENPEIRLPKRQRTAFKSISIMWKSMELKLKLRIMFYVAITSIKHCQFVFKLDRRFTKLTEFEDFHRKVNICDLPWMPWRQPTSCEYKFMALCRKADNPEIFFRMLIVDVFEHNRFTRVEELIAKVISGGHQYSEYAAFVFRMLTNDKSMRQRALSALAAIMAKPGGRCKLETYRSDMCSRLIDYHNMFMNNSCDLIHPYCLDHEEPHIKQRLRVECVACMADIELKIYHDRSCLRVILRATE